MLTRLFAALLFGSMSLVATIHGHAPPHFVTDELSLPAVEINDNRRPAGELKDGVLTLELRAARGMWHPEGDSGAGIEIEAFGDADALYAPAPLIRVSEGTQSPSPFTTI